MSQMRVPLDSTLERMDYGRALKEALLMPEKSFDPLPYARPLLDAVMLFEEFHIGYALVGGIAAMYYGRPRFTDDVDFVAMSEHMDLLKKNPEAMTRFHFDPTCTFTLYHQAGVQIDIWNDQFSDGVVDRAIEIQLAGRVIRVADPHDLIAMKLRAYRLIDDYDISQIARANVIDLARLQSLVTVEQLAAFHAIMKRA